MSQKKLNPDDATVVGNLGEDHLGSQHPKSQGVEAVCEYRPRKLIVILVVSFAIFLMLAACSVIGGVLLLTVVVDASHRSRKEQLIQQMEQIGEAINAYHVSYGHYPALHGTDQSGHPGCSWRVAIASFLPDVLSSELPDFSRDWNSPSNSKVGLRVPSAFISPLVANPPTTTETHVFAVTHPQRATVQSGREINAPQLGAAVQDEETRKFLLAAYLPNHTTHWAAPVDIALQRLQDEVLNATPNSPVVLLFTDGSIFAVENPLEPFVVRELVNGRSEAFWQAN
ncbi:DUF1559 domain-containing protein [bacterium]|nr:DUF1559 domain-containing protein [bacterium]